MSVWSEWVVSCDNGLYCSLFVSPHSCMCLNHPAASLKSTLILKFQSTKTSDKIVNCSIDGLELFSCSLLNEDETALSILDPVSISVDVKPPGPEREEGAYKGSPPGKETLLGSAQTLQVRDWIQFVWTLFTSLNH